MGTWPGIPNTVGLCSAAGLDSDVESTRTVSESNQALLECSLLTAAADKDSRESGSSWSESPQQGEQLNRR